MSESTNPQPQTQISLSSPLVATKSGALSAQNHLDISLSTQDVTDIRLTEITKLIRKNLGITAAHKSKAISLLSTVDTELTTYIEKASEAASVTLPTITQGDSPFKALFKQPTSSISLDRNAPVMQQWVTTSSILFLHDNETDRPPSLFLRDTTYSEVPPEVSAILVRLVKIENRIAALDAYTAKLQSERANMPEYEREARAEMARDSLAKLDESNVLINKLTNLENISLDMPSDFGTLPV